MLLGVEMLNVPRADMVVVIVEEDSKRVKRF